MKRLHAICLFVFVGMQAFFSLCAFAAEPARAMASLVGDAKPDRVAVVIGISGYPSGALANPKNDATAMAASLKKLGFDVELKLDASKADLDAIFKRFGSKAEKATVAALFYAGHGVQVNGANYIVPVDAKPQNERDLKREMVRMDDVIDDMGGAKVKLVFFDACRDNPLSRSFNRGGSRGMAAPVEATGTLISFATKHGNTAADGDGRHSPYSKALLEALEDPAGVEIEQMLRKVQQGVRQATNGQQEPWRYGSLDGEFYFVAAAPQVDAAKLQQEAIERSVQEAMKRAAEQTAARGSEQQARDREASSLAVEMSYWDSIKTSTSADDFKAYVKRYPKGSFVELAHNRIGMLEREAKKPADDARGGARAAPAGVDQTAVELTFWDSIKNSSSADDLKEYLASYPQGRFAGLARNRLRSLGAAKPAVPVAISAVAAAPPPAVTPTPVIDPPPISAPVQLAMVAPSQPASAAASGAAPGFPVAGDTWTYRYVDGWKKDSPQTVFVRVEEVEGGRITDRMSLRPGRGSDERTYEGKPDAFERSLGSNVRVVEVLPYVQGLLQEGLKSGQEKDLPDLTLGGQYFRGKVKLLGSEKVSVPAGIFDALRVEIAGRRIGPPLAASQQATADVLAHTIWFVAEIHRVVKVEHTTSNRWLSRLDDDTLELVAFSGSLRASQSVSAPLAEVAPAVSVRAAVATLALPQVGDSWVYRYIDGWKKDSPQTVTVKVAESGSGRVTDKMSMRGGRGADERTYEGRVDAVERPLGSSVRVVELLPYVQSLLQDGIKPGQDRAMPDLVLAGERFRAKAKLVGEEKISVPAGSFTALRVEIAGRRIGPALNFSQQGTVDAFAHTVWFVPEIRRVVRVEHTTRNPWGSRLDNEVLELISFVVR